MAEIDGDAWSGMERPSFLSLSPSLISLLRRLPMFSHLAGKWRRRNIGKEEERKPLRIYLPRGFVFGGGGQTETVGCDFTSRELTVRDTARKKLDPTECFPCFFFRVLEVARTGVSILGSLLRDPITPPSKRRRRLYRKICVSPPLPSPLFLICAISRTPFQKWKTEERNEGGKRGGFRLEGLLSGNCPLAQVFGLAGREAGTCSIFPPLGRKGQISQCFSSLPALPSSLVTYVSRRWEGREEEREREFRAQVTQKIASVRPSSSSSGKRGVYVFRKYLHFYAR